MTIDPTAALSSLAPRAGGRGIEQAARHALAME